MGTRVPHLLIKGERMIFKKLTALALAIKENQMKNIIIKVRENEDRSVIFKFPKRYGKIDLQIALHPLKQGVITVTWEPKEVAEAMKRNIIKLKENKDGKINNKGKKQNNKS